MVIARALLFASLAAAANATATTLVPLDVVAQHVPGFLSPTLAGAVAADFEGIGHDDVAVAGIQRSASTQGITPGEPRSGIVAILHYDAQRQAYAIAQTLITDDEDLAGIALDPSSSAGPGLVLVSQAGMLTRYSGWPLALVSRVSLGRPVSAMQVGDVDGDGHPEVVVTQPYVGGLAAYDLVSGALVRSYAGRFSDSLALAQLDAGPALEIVLSGAPGYVVDGATNATDWEYAGGIGAVLAAGTVTSGSGQGFVAASERYLSTFRGTPYSPIWSLDGRYTAVDFAHLDGNTLLLLGSRDGSLEIVDPLTQTALHTLIADPVGHLAAGHFEGGTAAQVVSSSGLETTGADSLVINGFDGSQRYTLTEEDGPMAVTAAGDVDGDGRADGIWASYYSDSEYDGGFIHVYDPANGAERWRTRVGGWLRGITALALTPGAGRSNIAVAAVYFYTPELYLIDGTTQGVIASNTSTPFANQRVHHLIALDGDLLAAASDSSIELARFSGTDLHAIWHQVLDSAYGTALNGLSRARLNGPASNDALLATSKALVAYDLDGLSVLWSIATPTASAALLSRADGTPVIGALGADGHVRLFSLDGATTLADFAIGSSEPEAIVPLENIPGLALACIDRKIDVVDIDAGAVVQSSAWIGGVACSGGSLAATPVPNSSVSHVVAASIVGAFDLYIATDALFADGFEGP